MESAIEQTILWWQALTLGAVQGLTEYLPISSSGHLAVVQKLLGLTVPLRVDLFLHLGTLIPAVWVFRKKILRWILACLYWAFPGPNRSLRMESVRKEYREIPKFLAATAVTFAAAFPQRHLGLKEYPALIGIGFLISAGILFLQHRSRKPAEAEISWKIALAVGLAQGIAAFPGISRAGATIGTALLLGLERRKAAEFSFLLLIPVVLGGLLFEFGGVDLSTLGQAGQNYALLFLSSCLSGFLALLLLLKLLQTGRFLYFAYYLVLQGIFTIGYLGL